MNYMTENSSQREVVRLRDIPVGNCCMLIFNHKNGVDPMAFIYTWMTKRSELCVGKNGQEHMVIRIIEKRVSISGNTAAIDLEEFIVVRP